ncbi:MAG: hypothetical protein ACRDLB_10550 [Actinomycetota bacterium]
MTRTFARFATGCALLAALAGVVFTVSFAIVVEEGERWAQWVAWSALFTGGLASIPVMTALNAMLGEDEPQFVIVAFVLGISGALGAAIHGAFDLALLANPLDVEPSGLNAVDPRGVLTFGTFGLGLGLFGWLMLRTGRLPRLVARLALGESALLLLLYLSRVTVLDPETNVIRVAALLSGLVVLPAFYVMLGRAWSPE